MGRRRRRCRVGPSGQQERAEAQTLANGPDLLARAIWRARQTKRDRAGLGRVRGGRIGERELAAGPWARASAWANLTVVGREERGD
ncbi:hypothetical protein E2562_004972 [Oryza meyeriana var. granulata]|uniref:Uncharacterized protein n=1 Tax=Oryza meyeriana var. granulata TaxID=110450 RepID=A0A6G1C610_9ORYZ|nr:hypothetical protein E2562_004972 [Oryza meyeriana var. granulata]